MPKFGTKGQFAVPTKFINVTLEIAKEGEVKEGCPIWNALLDNGFQVVSIKEDV